MADAQEDVAGSSDAPPPVQSVLEDLLARVNQATADDVRFALVSELAAALATSGVEPGARLGLLERVEELVRSQGGTQEPEQGGTSGRTRRSEEVQRAVTASQKLASLRHGHVPFRH